MFSRGDRAAASLFLAACLGGVGSLGGQEPRADVRGQVLGFAREPLARVTLVFHHSETNQQQRLQTDAEGRFLGQGFPAGRYRVAILRAGQIIWVVSGVDVPGSGAPEAGAAVEVDLNLAELSRAAAETRPVLDVELQRRLRVREEEAARQVRVRDHYRAGMQALERGEHEPAIREFEAARDLEASAAVHHAKLGEAYAAAGRLLDALAAYESALKLDPGDPNLRNNLGVALARAGRTEEALTAFRAAAHSAGEFAASIYFNWGATLYNAGRYGEAVEPLRRATQGEKADPAAFYFLGESLLRTSPSRRVDGREQVDLQGGTLEAFERYLELAPEGKYAEAATAHLKRLRPPATP